MRIGVGGSPAPASKSTVTSVSPFEKLRSWTVTVSSSTSNSTCGRENSQTGVEQTLPDDVHRRPRPAARDVTRVGVDLPRVDPGREVREIPPRAVRVYLESVDRPDKLRGEVRRTPEPWEAKVVGGVVEIVPAGAQNEVQLAVLIDSAEPRERESGTPENERPDIETPLFAPLPGEFHPVALEPAHHRAIEIRLHVVDARGRVVDKADVSVEIRRRSAAVGDESLREVQSLATAVERVPARRPVVGHLAAHVRPVHLSLDRRETHPFRSDHALERESAEHETDRAAGKTPLHGERVAHPVHQRRSRRPRPCASGIQPSDVDLVEVERVEHAPARDGAARSRIRR